MSNKCCRGEGEGRKDKGGGGGSRSCVWQSGMWKMVCDRENCVCDKVLCERSCVWKLCVKGGVWQSGVWKMVCGKRTMCRVPRCRAETSKHVAYSCDCTIRKVHCWIRKCKTPQNMNWVQARHWHFCLASDFFPLWVKIKTGHASSWTDDRRTPMKGECHQVPSETTVDVTKHHACHTKRRWSDQVPRLPRKVGRRHRRPSTRKGATRASPMP